MNGVFHDDRYVVAGLHANVPGSLFYHNPTGVAPSPFFSDRPIFSRNDRILSECAYPPFLEEDCPGPSADGGNTIVNR